MSKSSVPLGTVMPDVEPERKAKRVKLGSILRSCAEIEEVMEATDRKHHGAILSWINQQYGAAEREATNGQNAAG